MFSTLLRPTRATSRPMSPPLLPLAARRPDTPSVRGLGLRAYRRDPRVVWQTLQALAAHGLDAVAPANSTSSARGPHVGSVSIRHAQGRMTRLKPLAPETRGCVTDPARVHSLLGQLITRGVAGRSHRNWPRFLGLAAPPEVLSCAAAPPPGRGSTPWRLHHIESDMKVVPVNRPEAGGAAPGAPQ